VRLAKLEPGALFRLTATDLGAREDLPAWCRLTGHRLERAEPPLYLIARRPDPPEESR
jgi:tRNA 2-thiouridine synthesizing protein A